jgi:superfamily II DNA or RNA helicase
LLRDLSYDKRVFTAPRDNICKDLINPLMGESKIVVRGAGFFTSNILKYIGEGICKIISKQGKITFIICNIIAEKDYEGFCNATEIQQNEMVVESLVNGIDGMKQTMERSTITALTWLITDGFVEFLFVIPKNGIGIYHEKTAIFEDENHDIVVTQGSGNDSQNVMFNGEIIDVYRSWQPGEEYYVNEHKKHLEDICSKKHDDFYIFDMPEFIKSKWVHIRKNTRRPYSLRTGKFTSKEEDDTYKEDISVPITLNLREYQERAVESWFQNNCTGIYAMATAAGKSYTALVSSVRQYNKEGQIFTIISVPLKSLITQWEKDAVLFGYKPVSCYSDNRNWRREAKTQIYKYNSGVLSNVCLIVTHSTNSSEDFLSLVKLVKSKTTIMYIADEVHHFGAVILKRCLIPEISLRLGLSATPERSQDKAGTDAIYGYFKSDIFQFDVDEGIEKGFLSRYTYNPVVVNLTEYEQEKYVSLTREVWQLRKVSSGKGTYEVAIKRRLFQRAGIINKAENKIHTFCKLLNMHVEETGRENFKNTIVFAPEGKSFGDVKEKIRSLNLSVASITDRTSISERERILKQFEDGIIQILVVMKCADEGLNLPRLERAYIIASTTNPRQPIQRRGRILRLPKGITNKEAAIYDFLVLPNYAEDQLKEVKGLVRREMARFSTLIKAAENDYHIKNSMEQRLQPFGLGHLPYLKHEDYSEEEGGYSNENE